MERRAFTVLELAIAVAIIALLAVLSVTGLVRYQANSKLARVSTELSDIAAAVSQYADDNNYQYPPDTQRSVPPGLEKYLAGGVWPTSVWPHGVFDWDNWTTVNNQPVQQILQVSYRLCDPIDNPNEPLTDCADPILFPTFTEYSAIFYCLSGPCVPHQNYPTAPGYCVDCRVKKVNY